MRPPIFGGTVRSNTLNRRRTASTFIYPWYLHWTQVMESVILALPNHIISWFLSRPIKIIVINTSYKFIWVHPCILDLPIATIYKRDKLYLDYTYPFSCLVVYLIMAFICSLPCYKWCLIASKYTTQHVEIHGILKFKHHTHTHHFWE